MDKPRVLVVEDEPAFARLISLSLQREGFEVDLAATGLDGVDLAAERHPDVVLLDLALPDAAGLEILEELRTSSDVPIVLVTGQHTAGAVRRGLDGGADDYVTKPFAPAELAARVRAVLRRRHRSRGARHRIGSCTVDLDARRITTGAGAWVAGEQYLGRGGWRLLEALLDNPGRILYHDELLATAFGPGYLGDGPFLQEQIRRLRRALGIPARSEGAIRTFHGLGYAYEGPGESVPGPARIDETSVPDSRKAIHTA